MTGFLGLPYPYPQIAEALAHDNDEVAEYFLQISLVRGMSFLAKRLSPICPPSKRERFLYAKELLRMESEHLLTRVGEIATISADILRDEPPF